jgi:hypothetical protein
MMVGTGLRMMLGWWMRVWLGWTDLQLYLESPPLFWPRSRGYR